MSDIVDQIEKLKEKAHKLKEGVSYTFLKFIKTISINTEKIFGGFEEIR